MSILIELVGGPGDGCHEEFPDYPPNGQWKAYTASRKNFIGVPVIVTEMYQIVYEDEGPPILRFRGYEEDPF